MKEKPDLLWLNLIFMAMAIPPWALLTHPLGVGTQVGFLGVQVFGLVGMVILTVLLRRGRIVTW